MLLYSIKVRKASKRAFETREQILHRQEQNRTHLACAEGSALQCCSLALFPALCNVCRLVVQNSHRISCCKQEQAGEVSLEVAPTISPSLWPRPDPQWKESGEYKLKSLGLQKKVWFRSLTLSKTPQYVPYRGSTTSSKRVVIIRAGLQIAYYTMSLVAL